MASAPQAPVFFDPRGRRWRYVRGASFGATIVVTVVGAVLIASVLANPVLPALHLQPAAGLPHAADVRPELPSLTATRLRAEARRAAGELRRAEARLRAGQPVRPSGAAPAPDGGSAPAASPLAIGFYVNWDDSSYASLERNLDRLDWLMPQWLYLDGEDTVRADVDARALDLVRRRRPDMRIVPLLQNFRNEGWDAAAVAPAVASDASRRRLVDALARFVEQNGFGGVCIDLEEVPRASQPDLLRFASELREAFRPRGWVVAETVPFDDSDWNYRAYSAATDYLMLMAYDEHWATGSPGPIAGQDWFERTLARRMAELPPDRTVVCVGGYGYDWSDREREATEVTFQEAVLASRDSEATIEFDAAARNPHFRYVEDDGSSHTVWFLDAVSGFDQMRAARAYGVAGIALWRLGAEDPSLWSVFGRGSEASSVDGLGRIVYGYDVDFEGDGEILQVAAEPQDGAREVTVDPATGLISSERYTRIPSSYVIRKSGYRPGLIALTFDDGPDAMWTPKILDVLKEKGAPATFFVIGASGEASPDVVRRIVAEGNDIGNHTYTHPNLGEVPGPVTDLELNATQRLIEALTGRGTVLFRAPYFGDAMPQTPDEVEPIVRAEHLGYVSVGLQIDPNDWQLPGADAIVDHAVAGALATDPDARGQVVLLHDGGGDRSQTLEALPRIIDELRARGFRFVTVSQLAGMSRDEAMPPVPVDQSFFARADEVAFLGLSVAGWLLQWIFYAGIALGLGRLLFVGALAVAQWRRARRRERSRAGETYTPFVSVIVPAYNEERVIAKTLASLLASTYPSFEVLVVDDGSSDRTRDVVRERFAGDARVRLLAKENGGKAEALNCGLDHAQGEIVVALDADTVFPPDVLGRLARRFADPRVGAVAGNAKVGNRINTVTRWQALEYITSQNLDRRAFASLDCITVVPGAVGAWRREAIERAGGFSSDTLAEDQDLTLTVRRLGYTVGYEETAVAWTEAPDTIRGLAKQRFRWSFGTLQCLWKHRGALLRPRYGALGLVAMPNVWVFQILFPLVSPAMDLMLVWSVVSAGLERLEHPNEYAVSNLNQVLFYYALFLAVDWLAAGFAFALERREQWSLLWWLLLQRFCYRQVMYYVMVKSALVAIKGRLVGWGKLERTATVAAGQEQLDPAAP